MPGARGTPTERKEHMKSYRGPGLLREGVTAILLTEAGEFVAGYTQLTNAMTRAGRTSGTVELYVSQQGEMSTGWGWYATYVAGCCVSHRKDKAMRAAA